MIKATRVSTGCAWLIPLACFSLTSCASSWEVPYERIKVPLLVDLGNGEFLFSAEISGDSINGWDSIMITSDDSACFIQAKACMGGRLSNGLGRINYKFKVNPSVCVIYYGRNGVIIWKRQQATTQQASQ